jgi:hypothetical protein
VHSDLCAEASDGSGDAWRLWNAVEVVRAQRIFIERINRCADA